MPAQLRACVIGALSEWYQRMHHPSLRRLSDRVRLVAASYLPGEDGSPIAGPLGFDRAYPDFEEMLDREKPDFVFLCIAPEKSAAVAIRVLERRFPLFMEKPVGKSPADGRRVLAAAQAAGVPNMVAFNRRFNPLLLRAKQLIAERGGISQFVGEWLRNDVSAPRRMMGSSLHIIDAFRFLGGEVASFGGVGSAARYFDNGMIAVSMHLVFESGAAGSFTMNLRAGRAHERYRVMGENWTAAINLPLPSTCDDRWWMLIEDGDRTAERITVDTLPLAQRNAPWVQGFCGEHEHFVDCLLGGREPSPSVAEAVKSMELAQAMFRAVAPPEQVAPDE